MESLENYNPFVFQNKITVFQKNFRIDKVHAVDEIFVTGTFAGVIPVIEVDGITIGDGSRNFHKNCKSITI